MQANFLLAAGIVLFIFLVWVSTGGPVRQLLSPPGAASFSISTSSSLRSGSSTSPTRDADENRARVVAEVIDLQRSAVSAARFGTPSPYRDQVMLSLGTAARDSHPDDEYLYLSASSRNDNPIDITGWRIVSGATGRIAYIPQGVALPRSSSINAPSRIALTPGDRATVVMGESPVGMSFKENMCTGYLDQFQEFTPSLSHSCPAPLGDFDRFFVGDERDLDACRAYLSRSSRCEIPRDAPRNIGDACRLFIDTHLDYNGCVDAHQSERDFLTDSWRIYLERDDEFFTKDHDTVKLLDSDGLTVDLVSY